MQATRYLVALATACAISAFAFSSATHGKTVYSVPFDYKIFPSSSIYFTGKTPKEIDHLCKTGKHASNGDIAACEQRDFERLNSELNLTYSKLLKKTKETDEELKASGDPLAEPDFISAQDNWIKYRDSYCYAYVYAMGEASARYIYFWGCMKGITQDRIKQLEKFLDA
ncbi:lysozyme inhibitor LprI family protein [Paraburkholderia susongensis]|uniref:Lysozyme inhibitor LprI-like N-terminal domain-containing protein n=1 Tax=Paraburkholderia susongensis TaxID=1515439 RepID=A0A1X7IEL4_9BURK|nr:lysozyme inhibitor LprI family protein [Paraburkholderia susongensis]SMG13178.1 Protein of unknown function [Paraburkholderia susongensis]